MAEQILFNFAEGILHKLGSYALQQLGLALGVKKELKSLESSMSTVRDILLDAEEQQVTNSAVREWMKRLKDIVFDVDEMVDEFTTEALQRQVEVHGNNLKEVLYFFTRSNPLQVHYSTGRKIEDLRERLDEVLVDMDRFKFAVNLVEKQIKVRRREEAYSYVRSSDVIGREREKEDIIKLLTCTEDEEKLHIVPIVGMGGQGKTTLAQLVYNDNRVKDHFNWRLWVCVSDEFDMKEIIAKILRVAGDDSSCNNFGIEELQTRLRQRLSDKKFFLVLDDVWNEDRVKWIKLRDLLMVGPGGSRIVVTTRSRQVASIMGTVPSCNLKGLLDDDCLSVLLKWAFEEGDSEKYHNLVTIGKDIVRKCGGVPLAARTLGSLLYSIVDEKEWLSVRDTEVWALVQKENDILPVLRLSYDQMPSYLKQCFAYCSLLVKDEEIDKRKLIYLWMAQGFIKSSNPNEELEEKGESYFNELVRRSFLETSGGYFYKMHDLVHDLAQFVAGNDCLSLRSDVMTFIPDGVRHVSFYNQFIPQLPEGANTLHDGKKLRTILTYANTLPCGFISISTTFRCLRVLDLNSCDASVLSSVFKDLKRLRYLSMVWNHNNLPNSLSRLFNLQCLEVRSNSLEKLPKGFKNLINLRRLGLYCECLVLLQDKWIGRLTSLRSLSISFSRTLTSLPEGFRCFINLRILEMYYCKELVSLSPGMRHLVALEKITIKHCSGLQFTDDDFQGLTSLKSLDLYNLPLVKSLPMRLQCAAPTLTYLSVFVCQQLTTLSVSLENFTSLQSLEIVFCPSLFCLPKGIQSLTTLQSLKIEDCPRLSRKYSKNVGELWHHISHIPRIIIH